MGIEASKKEWKKGISLKAQQRDYETMKKLLTEEIKMSAEEADNLLYLMYPPYFFAFLKNPKLFQNIRLVPIDDDFHKEESLVSVMETALIRQQIIERSTHIDLSFFEFKKIEDVQWGALERREKISKAQIEAVLSRFSDIKLKELVGKYFSSMNLLIEHNFKRDTTMAAVVSRQAGEGLILLGSAHRRGVTKKLLALCRGL